MDDYDENYNDDWETGAGEYQYEDDDEVEFSETYKQRKEASEIVDTGRDKKSSRTTQEVALDQAMGSLSSNLYSEVSKAIKDKIKNIINELQFIEFLHMPTLVAAIYYKVTYKTLVKKEFQEFSKKAKGYENIEPLDLLRYIRTLN